MTYLEKFRLVKEKVECSSAEGRRSWGEGVGERMGWVPSVFM